MSKKDIIATAESTVAPKLSKTAARQVLWHKGILDWHLDDLQKELKKSFYVTSKKINTWLCSRRLGKSYALCTIALETCIKKPNSVVKYLAPEAKQVKTIIKPIIDQLISDAPEDVRPVFKSHETLYRFPNGSEIHIAGSDAGGAERLRGAKSDLCIVDEAGFCNDLKYVVRSILLPTMLTTGGKLILSSSYPTFHGHEFIDFIEQATQDSTLINKTIYDCPRYTPEFIEKEIISQYPGGKDDPEFKREYLNQGVRDENLQVIPEFTDELASNIIKTIDRPFHFDAYVAADWGVTDLTVVLFGYYDFKEAILVIEDELTMNGARMNTKILADAIKQKEEELWTDEFGMVKTPYMRVGDNNLLILQDMQSQHGLSFIPTEKLGKEGYLNTLRIMLQDERIIINPKCRTLITHLKFAQWNKGRAGYKRTNSTSHADSLDALIYLIRNLIFSKNPYPKQIFGENTFHNPKKDSEAISDSVSVLNSLFKSRRKF